MLIIRDGALFCAAGSSEDEIIEDWNYHFSKNYDWLSDYFESEEYFDIIEPVNSVDQILKIIKIINYNFEDCNIEILSIN